MMQGKRAAITGATGFIGRHVVAEIARRGWIVRALVHSADPRIAQTAGAAEVLRGDVRHVPTLRRLVEGVDAVVSLAARKRDEPDSEAVNIGGARNLVEACRAAGCSRVINVSTQSAKLARLGEYGRTKREADRVFIGSELEVTTLRPSLAYGSGDTGAFATVLRFVDRLPIVPILGDGRWISAPIHVADVARAIADCLETPTTVRRTYDLGGPDLVSFDALVDHIAECVDRPARKLHVPLELSLAVAKSVTSLWKSAPISVSNVLGSNQDTKIDLEPARRDFGFSACSLVDGLQRLGAERKAEMLRAEVRRLARYLLGIELDASLENRYAAATHALFENRRDRYVRFAQRHLWAWPWFDAAFAVLRRDSQVRQRVLVMAAILETCPQHAEGFLRAPPSFLPLLIRLAWAGLTSAARSLIGVVLLPLAWGSYERTK